MPTGTDIYVIGMALLRIFSGMIVIVVAILMFKARHVHRAMRINALLALVEPAVWILVAAIGITGLAEEISLSKLLFVILGVGFIFYGAVET